MIGFVLGIVATLGLEYLALKFFGAQVIGWIESKVPVAKEPPNP